MYISHGTPLFQAQDLIAFSMSAPTFVLKVILNALQLKGLVTQDYTPIKYAPVNVRFHRSLQCLDSGLD